MGASGHPSATSPTAYGWSQIFAAAETAPMAGVAFFAWPKATVAANRHKHAHIFFIDFPRFSGEAIVTYNSHEGKHIVWSSACLIASLLSRIPLPASCHPERSVTSKCFRRPHPRPLFGVNGQSLASRTRGICSAAASGPEDTFSCSLLDPSDNHYEYTAAFPLDNAYTCRYIRLHW
jgi:hypothetical protein